MEKSASYKEHLVFKTPPRTRIVWRYMSFAKFVWLIAKESLYFSRLDQHDDEWEGLLPDDWPIATKKYVHVPTIDVIVKSNVLLSCDGPVIGE